MCNILAGLLAALTQIKCGGESGTPCTVGQVLCNIKAQSFKGINNLLISFGYISGIGLLIAAVFKLKQVKDNPTQIPVSTPAALFLCGTLSLFLTNLVEPAGKTFFGAAAEQGVTNDQFEGTGGKNLFLKYLTLFKVEPDKMVEYLKNNHLRFFALCAHIPCAFIARSRYN